MHPRIHLVIVALLLVAVCLPGGAWAGEYRILPYLMNPRPDGITVIWFSEANVAGSLTVSGGGLPANQVYVSTPVLASDVAYHSAESTSGRYATLPYRHLVEVTGLPAAATLYNYSVNQNGEGSSGTFKTAPAPDTLPNLVRIIAFADAETEPESTGARAGWSAYPTTGRPTGVNNYPVDQTEGFRAHMALVAARAPDLLMIAGDIVETGGEQRDWDELWRHWGGSYAHAIRGIALVPAIGNHENYGGSGSRGGYTAAGANRSITKFFSYFPTPDNNGAADPRHQGRYYRQDYGRITVLTLDSNDGGLEQETSKDTNWNLDGTDPNLGIPDFNVGSPQWLWVEAELRAAAREGRLAIPQFHHVPYSSGVHGCPPGEPDDQSGVPMQIYSPLFEKYGVKVVIGGHDEMLELSTLNGVDYWDCGVAGDGLRGPTSDLYNPHRVWIAHYDAPEVWNGAQLVSGGKHYGHLEIDITAASGWNLGVALTPVMNFPLMNTAGQLTGAYERRAYMAPRSFTFTPMPYAQWRFAKFTLPQRHTESISGDLADLDGDGLSTLAEYALDTDPLVSSATEPHIRRVIVIEDGVRYLGLEVNRNPAATDLEYTVEASTNLADWTTDDLVTVIDIPGQLVVRDALPIGELAQRHLRCRILWLP